MLGLSLRCQCAQNGHAGAQGCQAPRDPAFDTGNKDLRLLPVQVFTGNLQYGVVANPWLLPELGAMYRLLSTADPTRLKVWPRGNTREVQVAWEDLGEATEIVRLSTEVQKEWEASFSTGLGALLDPRELLALPGMEEATLFAGGDSTPNEVGRGGSTCVSDSTSWSRRQMLLRCCCG